MSVSTLISFLTKAASMRPSFVTTMKGLPAILFSAIQSCSIRQATFVYPTSNLWHFARVQLLGDQRNMLPIDAAKIRLSL